MIRPTVGARVVTVQIVDRYPLFSVPAGKTGTVVLDTPEIYAVRMDALIDGAEDWENEIHWYPENGDDPVLDLAFAPVPQDARSLRTDHPRRQPHAVGRASLLFTRRTYNGDGVAMDNPLLDGLAVGAVVLVEYAAPGTTSARFVITSIDGAGAWARRIAE